ncbi:MAG TPA: hypothetical protein VFG04_21515 [Planctomycetaceae bacterium]|nr:hypothetical protein [Planctomycetaceae bacterium]
MIKDFRWIAFATVLAWVGPALAATSALADGPAAPAAASKAKSTPPAAKSGDSKSTDKKPADKLTYMRVRRDAHEHPIALETATGHYVSTDGKPVTVDLIGAIHIGDSDYYRRLNQRFRTYDKVLFELVMPEGQSLKGLGDHKSNHPVGMLQQSLPGILDLDYQLKAIDYTAKNFEHADLSPDQMAEAIRKRGDNGASIGIKIFFDILNQANRQSEARAKKGADFSELQLLSAMFDPNRPLAFKKMFAEQMDLIGGLGTGLGSTLDTILVQDRNAAAMKVLKKEIDNGTRKIAIFYGAAHMPDFDRRLTEELKLKRESITWDSAWDLRDK